MKNLARSKIVIAGLGLIGGSLARALSRAGLSANLAAVDRDAAALRQALDEGVIAEFAEDMRAPCASADLVVLALPVLSIEAALAELKPILNENTVITDVASVKHEVVAAARRVFGEAPARFVPGHPIAGSERSGYGAARADLFAGRKSILTPLPHTDPQALALVRELWEICGAEVVQMPVEHHDEVLAATSHLPHLLAFALVDTLSQQGESEEIFRYAAGGFRDFTRIASSDPVMWRDIFLSNGTATVAVLDRFMHDLTQLRESLLNQDADALYGLCSRARESRGRFLEILQAAALKLPGE
ncbi:MAG: prephenate dehydrogenase/arogenate dehydrogenase family protein [Pseudomonadales bacterium]|jgi:3-phosphoshikimate 1-carboxyvinyltransferase|nr:prephenate dehydrogenase/arogenate dehydrogenase family protein [Pseudomonadales bacterium]